MVQGSSKRVSREFQECFKKFSRVLNGVLSVVQGCNQFYGCLREVQKVSWMFRGSLRVFQGRLRGVPSDLEG